MRRFEVPKTRLSISSLPALWWEIGFTQVHSATKAILCRELRSRIHFLFQISLLRYCHIRVDPLLFSNYRSQPFICTRVNIFSECYKNKPVISKKYFTPMKLKKKRCGKTCRWYTVLVCVTYSFPLLGICAEFERETRPYITKACACRWQNWWIGACSANRCVNDVIDVFPSSPWQPFWTTWLEYLLKGICFVINSWQCTRRFYCYLLNAYWIDGTKILSYLWWEYVFAFGKYKTSPVSLGLFKISQNSLLTNRLHLMNIQLFNILRWNSYS